MAMFTYPARVAQVAPGDFEVRFDAFPEAITGGGTPEAALSEARDALAAVIEAYVELGRPLPPAVAAGPGEREVSASLDATRRRA